MLKPLLLCFILTFLMFPVFGQQEVKVIGTVLRPDQQSPVPAASVSVLNRPRGVIADINGRFLIEIATSDTLVIQAIGYKPQKYKPAPEATGIAEVIIVLQEDTLTLQEVQVRSLPLPSLLLRPVPSFTRNPNYIPSQTAPPPAPAPLGGSPISALYNRFSREGKDRRHLLELKEQSAKTKEEEEKKQYNSFFKDNTGYE